VRAAIAAKLEREIGLPFAADQVCMTTGAAAACNVILKSILDPGDEVILLAPYFAEYPFYVGNHGGRVCWWRPVPTACLTWIASPRPSPRAPGPSFSTPPIIHRVGYIPPRSCAIWGPCSPSAQPALVISDEPYKSLVYDGGAQAEVAAHIAQTAICFSWSKAQALAGERIGFLALSPA